MGAEVNIDLARHKVRGLGAVGAKTVAGRYRTAPMWASPCLPQVKVSGPRSQGCVPVVVLSFVVLVHSLIPVS
jgi:hypothetical protein